MHMNYDLCDLLNRKLEAQCKYMPKEFPNKSNAKNQDYLDNFFQSSFPDEYLETIDHVSTEHVCYNFWVYRNGKFSDQIVDFDNSSRKIIKELANLSYSNNPVVDLLYFSGVIKLVLAKNKAMVLECCVRPTLDQMLMLKDLERVILPENGKVLWKISERRGKNNYHIGVGLDSLHDFRWAKIK